MKIVIDIPDEEYENVKKAGGCYYDFGKAILYGTPLPKGKWEVKGQDIYCSMCGEQSAYNVWGASKFSNYCPNCGADMRGDENADCD